MYITQAVAHAERIVKCRIESTVLDDVMQDEEVAALPTDAQQQILKIVHERVEPRTIAQTRR